MTAPRSIVRCHLWRFELLSHTPGPTRGSVRGTSSKPVTSRIEIFWIGALLDVVDAIGGEPPTVLDLACGTGTITCRLLDRCPAARSIAVDIDPVLLTIATATFDGDDRVRIVRADLHDPAWIDAVPEQRIDATITATSLHWLPEDAVRRLYRDLARLVRPGGVFAHAEVMPLVDLPVLGEGLARVEGERRTARRSGEGSDWDAWWESATQDPALRARARSDEQCSRPTTRPKSSRLPLRGTSTHCATPASPR